MSTTLFLALLASAIVSIALGDSGSCTCSCTTIPAGVCSTLTSSCNSAGATAGSCTDGSSTSFTCNFGACPANSDCQSLCDVYKLAWTGCSTMTASASCSSSSKCFPANATVQLEDGATKTMSQLKSGDRVLVGGSTFSDVYMFSHQDPTAESDFVRIGVSSSVAALRLTPDHYLYVNGKLAVAKTVRVGDTVTLASGESAAVTSVAVVRGTGLYNPHTLHGDIVVDGIKTSIYTSAINPTLAHAALFPVRLAYQMGSGDVVGNAFAQGSDAIANALPDGKEAY